MGANDDLPAERAELLRLRARVVVLERMALAALELALRVRPEDLKTSLEMARSRLSADYSDPDFAPDITQAGERTFVSKEVERLMRGVQSDMGFEGGVSISENG